MKTSFWAILGIIMCTAITSSAQLFWKIGADKLEFNVLAIITNWPLILGCVMYVAAAVVMIISLKYGELSVLYPFIALSFIWVALLSMHFLGESLNFFNWAGIVAILAGVSSIGVGAK